MRAEAKAAKPRIVSVAASRRVCATCARWSGERQVCNPANNEVPVICPAPDQGICHDGGWRGFPTLARQTCGNYLRWEPLAGLPGNVPQPTSLQQVHAELRALAGMTPELPAALQERLDGVLSDIDTWFLAGQISRNRFSPAELQSFWARVVDPLLESFFWLGWSRRKPLESIRLDDIWPL